MKDKKLITKLFNPRLFLEALKRLRVVGLATAILSLTVTALVPIATWMVRAPRFKEMTMDTKFLCVPVGVVVFLAPLFFVTLFSFLQKRKESDFFHAIPYTRTCVYVSFSAAALAFVCTIQAACGLVAGILWGMMPGLTFDLGGMVAYVFICMLAAAMMSSFMMLALTVSGTSGSCSLLYLLFAGFTRIVCLIFMGCVSTIMLIPYSDAEFLSPTWFLPINVIYYVFAGEDAAALMYSLSNILYSLAVTLGLFALAGFFYLRRKSEMAGNPAPGVRTQTLFRVLFTLPLALVIPLCLITGSDDSTLLLVLGVSVLLVYFLYELITTKRPKNMLKAIPSLGFVAGACILFSLLFHGYRTVVLYEKIEAEDIKTVSVDSDLFGSNTYQGLLLDTYRIDDEEICELIAKRLAKSQEYERENSRSETYYRRTTVTIRLKSGRTVRRKIVLNVDHTAQIVNAVRENGAVRDILYTLPADRELDSGNLRLDLPDGSGYWGFGYSDVPGLMEVFRKEFSTLTDEQRDSVLRHVLGDKEVDVSWGGELQLSLSGRLDGKYFFNRYIITGDMPLTRRYLLTLYCLSNQNRVDNGDFSMEGVAFTVLDDLEDTLNETHYQSISVVIQCISVDGSGKGNLHEASVNADQIRELITLLKEKDKIKIPSSDKRDLPGKLSFTADSWFVNFRVNNNGGSQYLYSEIDGLFELTPEDWKEIQNIIYPR